MGGVVDTSVFIYGERRSWTAKHTLTQLERMLPGQSAILSPIVVAELVHGIHRARTDEQASEREAFVLDLLKALPVATFSGSTAWIAGRIRGEQAKSGNTLPIADSLIAATALELNYAVITLNVKDFARMPGLRVIPFLV